MNNVVKWAVAIVGSVVLMVYMRNCAADMRAKNQAQAEATKKALNALAKCPGAESTKPMYFVRMGEPVGFYIKENCWSGVVRFEFPSQVTCVVEDYGIFGGSHEFMYPDGKIANNTACPNRAPGDVRVRGHEYIRFQMFKDPKDRLPMLTGPPR